MSGELDVRLGRLLRMAEEMAEENIQNTKGQEIKTVDIIHTPEIQIPDDLFNDIVGYDDVKELLLNALKNKKRMAFLFVGPPASAKTMFLSDLLKLPYSLFIVAYTTTQAGLRDIFISQKPLFLAIDEIDKAKNDTLHILISVIDTGLVQKNIANQNIETYVDTLILASSNNYDKISPVLKSRFQMFSFKEYTREDLEKIGYNMLDKEEIPDNMKTYIIEQSLNAGIIQDPRDFLKIANVLHIYNTENIDKAISTIKKYHIEYKH